MEKKIGFGILAFFGLCLLLSALFINSKTGEKRAPASKHIHTPSTSEDKAPDQIAQNPADNKIDTPQSAHTAKLAKASHHLVPHKALYDITLSSASSSSEIVNITGTMYFEWKESCDAWMTDHRFNLSYEYVDRAAMNITSDFSTWESKDGKTFNYSSRRSRDGEIYEEIRGDAHRQEGNTGLATYRLPKEEVVELPKGFTFPMQHTMLILEALSNPKTHFIHRSLFDGSDMDGPLNINAFIGKEKNALSIVNPSPKIDANLLNSPARRVEMAFFPLMDEDLSAADYEMSALFHKNSVISEMDIFYDEFSIKQTLSALEKTEKTDSSQSCNTSEK